MKKKFQNISKPKFEKNSPKLFSKTLLKNDKLNKIKRAFQKSKIKNKKALINLNKRVYNNKKSTDLLNTSFSELIKSNPNYTIPKFFEVYKDLFYNIPKKGEKSHHSLIEQSQEYINNYVDPLDSTLERLLELLEKKDEEFNLKENPEPKEHIFYPNGTFLRTYGANTEIVEGVPQALPIWVMQEGMKREFKSYDAYNVVKKAFGFNTLFYDTDKQELLGDKDADITEQLHVNDLNYIPTGADINSDDDLNKPPGPDRKIDISLSDILDYYKADITCLEGYDDPNDPNQVKVENYSATHDLRDACYIRYWVLDGTRVTSAGFSPGDTIQRYFRKDNPDFDPDDYTLGIYSNILQQQQLGEEDGIFDMKGYMRIDYKHPEGTPTRYVNIPFDTSISVDQLPSYIEPRYSDYGTRMYEEFGYGDQRKTTGNYESGLGDAKVGIPFSNKIWEKVLSDPSNAFYNGDYDWSKAKNCDGCENVGPNIRKGGGYKSRIYFYKEGNVYVQYLGRWNRSGVFRDRYFYVILDKDWRSHGPLSDGRVFFMYRRMHNFTQKYYWKHRFGGALRFSEAKKFPQDENGFYIPQEYWDEFGYVK